MKYGYVRLSLNEPTPEPQLKALRRAGVKTNTTYTDRVSGTKADWRYLKAALSRLQRGDTFVVWRLDRLSTSLKDLIERMSKFNEQGVRFISLTEKIDTATETGALVDIFGALAAFERRLNTEQTMVGIQEARARGKKPGRPPKNPAAETVLLAKKLFDAHTPISEILTTLNISRATLHRYIHLHSANVKT
jgi:DNA invertase Pin-like site-specific DNA recombinase